MSLSKVLLALGLSCVLALGILHISISKYVSAKIGSGCQPVTDIGYPDPTDTVAFWNNRTLTPILTDISSMSFKDISVLGVTSEEKWIEVDLSDQRLRAWQGNTLFLESPISSGLINKTPIGEYRIWYKVKYTKMEGGIKGTRSYYYLPNVPFAMFFYGDYGIHGTYWHNHFGTRVSHGCVNTPTSVAEKLFHWSDPRLPSGKNSVKSSETSPGTRVVIHD